MRPSKGFWEQENEGIYFREQGNKNQHFGGNMETKTILGTIGKLKMCPWDTDAPAIAKFM